MDIQNNRLLLVIGMPRAMTTAFTRGLAKSTKRSALHENLMAQEDETEVVPPPKGYTIRKEMAAFTISDLKIGGNLHQKQKKYNAKINQLIEKATDGVILITGNPLSIFYSIFKQSMQNNSFIEKNASDKKQLFKILKNGVSDITETVIDNYRALRKIKLLLDCKKVQYAIIDKSDIRTNPTNTIQYAIDKLNIDGRATNQMVPVASSPHISLNFFESIMHNLNFLGNQKDAPHYHIPYDDHWTSEADKRKTHIEPSANVQDINNIREKEIQKASNNIHGLCFTPDIRNNIIMFNKTFPKKEIEDHLKKLCYIAEKKVKNATATHITMA